MEASDDARAAVVYDVLAKVQEAVADLQLPFPPEPPEPPELEPTSGGGRPQVKRYARYSLLHRYGWLSFPLYILFPYIILP